MSEIEPARGFSAIPAVIAEIRAGRMVVVLDDEDRENEGDLIMAASLVRPEDVNFMAREARGLICLSLTRERCRQLGLKPMVDDNRSPHGTNFTVSIEAASGVTTGISAHDRAHTIRTAVQADAGPQHLTQPGHVFPLAAQPGGVLVRAGHTEAAADLAQLAGLEPAGVLVEILAEDGTMARRPQLEVFAQRHGLRMASIADLIAYRLATERTVMRELERDVDTELGRFRLHAFRDTVDGRVHFALALGDVATTEPVLVRVHVQDALTDLLHLRGAEFGVSVHRALAEVARTGRGVVVVLAQPEAGDAWLDRLRQGQFGEPAGPPPPTPDSAAAPDRHRWRQHGLGAQILRDLGVRRIRVLGTPRRFLGLSGFGLEVVEYVAPRER